MSRATAALTLRQLRPPRRTDGIVSQIKDLIYRGALRPGERLPLTVTAAGKVLLADLPPAELQAILRRRGFPRLTPKSLTSRRARDGELRQVREQGVGWSREECAVGLLSLAAPVRSGGRTMAAISIACPTNLVDGPALSELTRRLRQAAAQLSARLEGAGESGP